MKKSIFSLLVVFCICIINTKASTSIATANVSGHWTMAGSPYLIFNDITIPMCNTLTIDPGVEVVFQGYYSIYIYGSLHAKGTSSNYIKFHVNDTTGWNVLYRSTGSWKGMTWYAYTGCSYADSSAFEYCDVADIKSSLTANIIDGYRTDTVQYCNFHHMVGIFSFGNNPAFTYLELSHCDFYDIHPLIDSTNPDVGYNIFQYYSYSPSDVFNIHDCNIYNYYSGAFSTTGGTFIFQRNNVYNNLSTPISIGAPTAIVTDNKIYGNTDANVAALNYGYNGGGNITIERNYICNNYSVNGYATDTECGATQGGGAIRISGTTDEAMPVAIIRNNVIANNNSGFGGGGVYIINASAVITNNQFVNNSSARGSAITFNNYPSTVHGSGIIKNNLFYHNVAISYADTGTGNYPSAYDTSDVFVGYADTVIFERNWISSPAYKTLEFDALAGYIDLTYVIAGDTANNVIGSNPGLIAPTNTISITESAMTANFGLLATSPCINAGTLTGIDPGTEDYAGNNRTIGSTIDIGAYEYGAPHYLTTPSLQAAPDKTMNVYPNPASENVFILIPYANGTVTLLDMSGRSIKEHDAGSTLISFDVSDIPAGIYMVIWSDEHGKKQVEKVLVQ